MTTKPQTDGDGQPSTPPRTLYRWLRLFSAVMSGVFILWLVVRTELHVAYLRSEGFTETTIDSARDHAYFPLIGGVLGAALSVGVVVAIRRLFARNNDQN